MSDAKAQTVVPDSAEIAARIAACERELDALRRLRRLARAAERAEASRRARPGAAPQRGVVHAN
jgi:hypothetical protein